MKDVKWGREMTVGGRLLARRAEVFWSCCYISSRVCAATTEKKKWSRVLIRCGPLWFLPPSKPPAERRGEHHKHDGFDCLQKVCVAAPSAIRTLARAHEHKQTILPFYKQAHVKESHLLILLRGDGHITVCWLRWKTLLVIQQWWLYRRFFRVHYTDWVSAVQFKQPRHLNGMLFFSVCMPNCRKPLLNSSVKIEQTLYDFWHPYPKVWNIHAAGDGSKVLFDESWSAVSGKIFMVLSVLITSLQRNKSLSVVGMVKGRPVGHKQPRSNPGVAQPVVRAEKWKQRKR